MSRPHIDPGLDLVLAQERTLRRGGDTVSVVIPAHNERESIEEVVLAAKDSLTLLGVEGEVVVSASGCTDDTVDVASAAGARVVPSPIGKGRAILHGVAASIGDIVCLVDGDVRYFGDPPLVALLVEPVLRGRADACVATLYWRPVYPQLWAYGFFLPLAGVLYPELLAKAGWTPWSGQRAAVRGLYPAHLPDGYTADLALMLHWNAHATSLRSVLADDWTHPLRSKPELMAQEFELLASHAVGHGRIGAGALPALRAWFESVYALMAAYRSGRDDPQAFERQLLEDSLARLRRQLNRP